MRYIFTLIISLICFGSNAQMYLLNEDFSSSANTTPPINWTTNTQTGLSTDKWHFDNPGNRTYGFPITQPFAIFDSENYSLTGGNEIVYLSSPPVDASSNNNIFLFFDHLFKKTPNNQGIVEVFNGLTWNQVFVIDSNVNIVRTEIVDISAFAGGISNIKVRFKWSGNGGGYWMLDNIKIYAPILRDAGVTLLCSPNMPLGAGLQNIKVDIKNFGYTPITNVKVNWSVNNIIQTPFNWNGNLNFNQVNYNVTIGNYNFATGGIYNFKIWTSNPNGSNDLNALNDTITKTIYTSLCGTYTIGGSNPDYPDFQSAANALNFSGITCPVIFKVRNGTYNEHFILNQIIGSSTINTVKFESESGNADLCKLSYQLSDPTNDYTLQLNGTDYISFKKLSISRQAGAYNIIIKNNCKNINFEENILQFIDFDALSRDSNFIFNKNRFNGSVKINKTDTLSKYFTFTRNENFQTISITNLNNLVFDSNTVRLIPISLIGIRNGIIKRNNIIVSANGYPGPAINISNSKKLQIDSNYCVVSNCSGVSGFVLANCFNAILNKNTIEFNLTQFMTEQGMQLSVSDSIIIKNNSIKGIGAYGKTNGILINGNGVNQYGITIENNTINLLQKAILANKIENLKISGNTITNMDTLFLKTISCKANIINNTFDRINYGDGLDLNINNTTVSFNKILNIREGSCLTLSGSNNIVFNNFLHAWGLGIAKGIVINDTLFSTNIYFNSVNINSADPENGRALEINGSTNCKIKNNIFSNKGEAYSAFYTKNPISAEIDYNDYYSFKKKYVSFLGVKYDSLDIWKNSSIYDQNSKDYNPYFENDNILKHNQIKLYNAAIPISGITSDIYYSNRLIPDIGATEYTTCNTDAGVHRFYGLKNPLSPANYSIKLELQNHGSTTLTSAKISWTVNGVAQTVYNWIGNLAQGQSTIINIGSINFTPTTTYQIKAWTSFPNSLIDCNFKNDTSYINDLSLKLCGTYTIGGINPNFANFDEAVNALNHAGISCQVIFKVRTGIYKEHIHIKSIDGSSPINTVTFESENGNNSSVNLLYQPYDPNNDYTIRLDSCKNIIFKNLSIYRDSGAVNIHLIKNSANAKFIGNRFGNLISENFDSLLFISKNIVNNSIRIIHDSLGFSKNIKLSQNNAKDVLYRYCNNIQSDSNSFTGISNVPTIYLLDSKNAIINYDSIYTSIGSYNVYLKKSKAIILKNSLIKNMNSAASIGIYSDSCTNLQINRNFLNFTTINITNGIYCKYSDSIQISSNKIIAPPSSNGLGILSDYSLISSIKISGNLIQNFKKGLNVFLGSNSDFIYNNDIQNGVNYAIKTEGKYGKISKNRINNFYYGNGIENKADNTTFSENRITNIFEGIAFMNKASNVNINNNYLHSDGFSLSVGIKLSDTDTNINIKFNNINIKGNDLNLAIPLLIESEKQINIYNNILKNNGKGYCLNISNNLLQSDFNYNCYFTKGQYIIKKQNAKYITVNDWFANTSYDQQSKLINPFYTSDTNLKINQIQLNNIGLSDNLINKDIDSTLRSIPPDIGAKEFTPCNIDAGIDSLIGISHNMATSSFPIIVLLQNQGIQTLNSVKIYYSINNVTQSSIYNWTGNLASGATTQVNIGNYTFLPGVSSIDLKCWTALPNNTNDCNYNNDSSSFDKVSIPLCGIYTIGGINPNFQNFSEAANALNLSGISCPVTFKVRNGIYNERIQIGPVMGNNYINSITFVSENNIPDSVILKYSNLDPQNDFCIKLDSVINFNLLKFSILRTNGNYSIIYKNKCSKLLIDSCKINNIITDTLGIDSLLTVQNTDLMNNSIQITGGLALKTKNIYLRENINVNSFNISKSKTIVIDSNLFLMNSLTGNSININLDSCDYDTVINCKSVTGNKASTAVNSKASKNIYIKNNNFTDGSYNNPVVVKNCYNVYIAKNNIKSNAYNSIDLKKTEKLHIQANKLYNNSNYLNSGIISDDSCLYIKIDSNEIINFTNGIFSKLKFSSDSIFRNYIKTRSVGISVNGDSGIVRQNIIDTSTLINAINVSGNNLKILQNKIINLTQSKGINITGSKNLVANNFVSIGGLGVAKGIVLNSNTKLNNIIHNSINIYSSDQINGRGIEILGGDTFVIKNNIFCNTGNGFASYLQSKPLATSWDYNVYYSPLKKIGWYNNITYDTLSNWATLLSGDANSMFINPYYVSNINLRPNQRFINGAGLLYPDVVVDIYDILRNLSAPDIGAVEFKVDFGVTELINPTLACTHNLSDTVKVLLKQYGDIPFTNITIAYQVNNGLIVHDTIHGAIINDLIHSFPVTVNLTAYGTYIFKIWLTSNNDDNPNNDTLIVTRYSNLPPQISNLIIPNSCERQEKQFNSDASISSPFTISNYIWNFGNGDSAFIKNPIYQYDSIGMYSVNLKVFSSAGCYKDTTRLINVYATPHASYTTNPNCNGFPVVFTNTSYINGSDSILYKWNFGDNTFSIQKNPSHIYTNNSQYYSNLISYTVNGCSDTLSKLIKMNPSPVLQLQTHNSECGLPNGYINTNVSSGTLPYSYLWSNGSTAINLTNILQGHFVIIVTDSNLCVASDSANIVSPVQALDVVFNSNNFICEGFSNGWINASISGGVQPYSINWNTGQNSDSIYNLNSGVYTINITDISNCSFSDSITLFSTPNPVIDHIKTDVLCFGQNNGTASAIPLIGISPFNYYWFTNPVQTTQTINNLTKGNYILKVIDNAGCIGYDSIEINQPDSISSSFSFTNPICNNGYDGSITALVTGGIQPYSFLWNNNPSLNSANITNLNEGLYQLTVTDSNNCSKTFNQINLVALNQIHAAFTATPTVGFFPLAINFTFTGSGANSYLWDFGDGNTSAIMNPSNIYQSSNNFLINLTVSSGLPYNCTDTASMSIFIDKPSDIIIPNIFTPNGDGINDFFNIQITNIIEFELIIYNRWGREIFISNSIYNQWDGKINNQEAATGVYFFLLKAKGKDSKKFEQHGSVTLLR